jgi:ornithine cyclodeaminase/alanine dehydrogenase-like protein (mu-crystallin family)
MFLFDFSNKQELKKEILDQAELLSAQAEVLCDQAKRIATQEQQICKGLKKNLKLIARVVTLGDSIDEKNSKIRDLEVSNQEVRAMGGDLVGRNHALRAELKR